MASRLVGRTYDTALEASGVNVVQYSILINIARYAPITQMDLAEHLEMERTTLYRALDVLEKSGLVISRPTGGGVARAVSLTARGRKVTTEAEVAWKKLHEGFVGRFGEQRLNELNALLAAVRDHFRGVTT